MHIQYIGHFELGFCSLDSFAMHLTLALNPNPPASASQVLGLQSGIAFHLEMHQEGYRVNTPLCTHQMEHRFQNEQQTDGLISWGIRVPLLSKRIKLQHSMAGPIALWSTKGTLLLPLSLSQQGRHSGERQPRRPVGVKTRGKQGESAGFHFLSHTIWIETVLLWIQCVNNVAKWISKEISMLRQGSDGKRHMH